MGICLVVVKSGQQLLGDVEIDEKTGIVSVNDPLLIGWVRPDKKLTRLLMTLSVFPPMFDAVMEDLSGHHITLTAMDVLCIESEKTIKVDAVKQYREDRRRIYGGIEVVPGMPHGAEGRA